MSRIRFVKGKIIKTTGGNYNMYSNGNIVMNAGGVINLSSENQIIYGAPEDPPRWKNPKIIEMQFLNENGKILKNETIAMLGDICATNILYGKKLKIKFFTKDVKDGTKIEFKLKGNSKDDCQDFFQINKLSWNLEINNNTCETDFFTLNTSWYSENFEYYNYKLHRTEIKAEELNTFSVKGTLDFKFFELPENHQDDLKPIAYLRNYEELIGLFSVNNIGQKALIDNYENKFINYNPEIFEISREFSGYLNYSENLTLNDIKARVETDAKKLWETAVKGVQEGNLDDRPLYWARNKMEVSLKRNALFENDIDFESSIVKKDSELDKMIHIFEEKSRNYTDVDFNKAGYKKKVLITGFDPFIINQFDHPENKSFSNILQSNPSGVVALALANNDKLGAFIQTMIVPVRYTDFDGSQDNAKGQGEGIIEKYIKLFINQVDMIITVSQAGEGDYHIDVFATATREGFNDNMDFIRIDKSKSVNDAAPETIKTTLPIQMTQGKSKAVYWGEYNQKGSDPQIATLENLPKGEVYNGPGGNYLSNEIFYRVAKMRSELRPTLKTGHFHISMIQPRGDLDFSKAQELLETVKQTLKEGFKTL